MNTKTDHEPTAYYHGVKLAGIYNDSYRGALEITKDPLLADFIARENVHVATEWMWE